MPDQRILDDAALASVLGGGTNVDTTATRWRTVQVRGVPVPYPVTRTTQQRTPFGACVDRGVAACHQVGGDGARIGSCELGEIRRCWQDRTHIQEAP